MAAPVRVLVVGCGHMGTSHAKAYEALPGFEIAGVVARGASSRRALLDAIGADRPQFSDYATALTETRPAADGSFARADELIDCSDEPDHDGLCRLEQEVFLDAIVHDRDLTAHMRDAVDSLRIVLAADEAFRSGRTVDLTAG